jgi:hypothetical protein
MTSAGHGLILWTVYRNKRGYVARQSYVSDLGTTEVDGVPAIKAASLHAIRVAMTVRGAHRRLAPGAHDRHSEPGIVEFWI